ncbi:MAG TPA: DUF3048 domain-containing protein [Tissierellales bacterium]|nr:DUF3048 domain-containing protein [Tissierellales bacterium]
MKKIFLILGLVLSMFLLSSCTKLDNITESEEEEEILEHVFSSLSGLKTSEDRIKERPVAIMFDNHPNARWQSGLSDAELVYEFKVEHPYTRYMGIYLIGEPELLGPIRSSRPYFVTTLLEYDSIYVRAGGSQEAEKKIKELNISDINGVSDSMEYFWRESSTGKESPHNLYTSMEFIRKAEKEKGYNKQNNFQGFRFNEEIIAIDGFDVNNIEIKYNKSNTTKYVFDKGKGNYTRYKDGELHIDESNEEPIIATNIIIQQVNSNVTDEEGRLDMTLIGEGNGIFITQGKGMFITWEKESISEKTYFYDDLGEELKLNPGTTWIQVTDIDPDLIIN